MTDQCYDAYLGLGSNIGDAKSHVKEAISSIAQSGNIKLIKSASFYLTKAWGHTDQNDFINTVVLITTRLTPIQLLKSMQKIENDMGRERKEKWGPRIIDIDILLYHDFVVNQQQLKIPHPYLTHRSFVLAPLFEIKPQLMIPGHGKLEKFFHRKIDDGHIITLM